jgi:thiamine transport system permease protein
VKRATTTVGDGLLVAVALVVGGFLGLFYLFPLLSMLARGWSSAVWLDTLASGRTWSVVWFTTWQSVVSTACTLVVGLPVARVLGRYRFRGRAFVRTLAVVPFVLPTVVVASAFVALDDSLGLEATPFAVRHTVRGIIAAHVFFNVAVIVRTVGGWWAQLDDRPEAAARTLGAGPVATFWYVTLPRLRPALASAVAIVFMFTFTSFGVILLLGGQRVATVETEVWRYATQRSDFETAAALGVIQLVMVVAMLVANSLLQSRLVQERQRAVADLERVPSSVRERLAVLGGVGLAGTVLGLPIVVLVERSLVTESGLGFGYYRALSGSGDRIPVLPVSGWQAVVNSLQWGLLATVIATVVGTLAAIITTSRHRRLGRVADVAFLAPLGTSAVLVGFGMLIALDTEPFDWRSRWWIVPVAQAVIGTPFVMRSVATSLRSIEPALREVAATLGASPWAVVRSIDVPIASRAVAAGSAFAFAVSVGEFGATTFLARPQRPTVPTAIFRLLGRPGSQAFGEAMALSVILLLITGVAMLLIERFRSAVAGEL